MSQDKVDQFLSHIFNSIQQNDFVKLTIANPFNKKQDLTKILIKSVKIKDHSMLCFVYRYKTKDITKNYETEVAMQLLRDLLGKEFKVGHLFLTSQNIQIEFNSKGIAHLRKSEATHTQTIDTQHNRQKHRLVAIENNAYLRKLGVTNANNTITKNMESKYRQIDKYIEILDKLVNTESFRQKQEIHVMDMGSGKGYLSFALYDHMKNSLKLPTFLTGIEFRPDMVDLCNRIAKDIHFDQLDFKVGKIEDQQIEKIDILIALHACDTATDDAIFAGIKAQADLIICAPCCHKEARQQITCQTEMQEILKFGILEQRQSEILTDGIRALLLELHGYKTNVFEFISTEHTAKNLMLVAAKTSHHADKSLLSQRIVAIKNYFGLKELHLEKLLFHGKKVPC